MQIATGKGPQGSGRGGSPTGDCAGKKRALALESSVNKIKSIIVINSMKCILICQRRLQRLKLGGFAGNPSLNLAT